MFTIGDVIIKQDLSMRSYIPFNTRHHMMIIVGVNVDNKPLIAHMKFTDSSAGTGTLVIEVCPKIKDAVYVHVPHFTKETRARIEQLTRQLASGGYLQISRDYLERQHTESNGFRDEVHVLLDKLKATAWTPIEIANIHSPTFMSCHEFVLAVIHQACSDTGVVIPTGLAVSPQWGWSDLLFSSVSKDPTLVIKPFTLQPTLPRGSFFNSQEKKMAPNEESRFSKCLLQ